MFQRLWNKDHFDDLGKYSDVYNIYNSVIGKNYQYSVEKKNNLTTSDRLTSDASPVNGITQKFGTGVAQYKKSLEKDTKILEKVNFCKTIDINTLISTYTPSENLRCGWIYKSNPGSSIPSISKGAYGTSKGPLMEKMPAGARWYWTIQDARDQYEKDVCDSMNSCGDLANTSYANICGWCSSRGKGIPKRKSTVPGFCGTGNDFVQRQSACPPVPPVPNICDIDPGTGFAIPCLSQLLKQAGCSDSGTIGAALSSSTDSRSFGQNLNKNSAFNRWKQTPGSLNASYYSQGSASKQVALSEFQNLQIKATSDPSSKSSINVAARDLCLGTDKYESYDFCNEITDSTRPPYNLRCVRSLFTQYGGTQQGILYPNNNNMTNYNYISTWGELKAALQFLQQNLESTNAWLQAMAIHLLTGIVVPPPPVSTMPFMNYVEILWIDLATNTLMERRIVRGFDKDLNKIGIPDFYTGGIVENTDKQSMVGFLAYVNIKPSRDMSINYRFTTDDGNLVTQNRQLQTNFGWGQVYDSTNYFSRYYDQAPTTHTNSACSTWKKNKDNILTIYWEQKYGWSAFNLRYSECNQGNFKPIDSNMLSLVQEPYAPFWSFEAYKRPNPWGVYNNILCEKRSQSNRENQFIFNGAIRYSTQAIGNNSLINGFNKAYTVFTGTTIASYSKAIAYAAFGTITMTVCFNDLPNGNVTILDCLGLRGKGFRLSLIKLPDGSCKLFGVCSGETNVQFGQAIQTGIWYFVVVRQNKSNNTFTFAVVPYPSSSDSLTANTLFNSSNSANLQSSYPFTRFTSDGSIAGYPRIGGYLFRASVLWVHMFDYELTSDMDDKLAKEINQTWMSSWYE